MEYHIIRKIILERFHCCKFWDIAVHKSSKNVVVSMKPTDKPTSVV